MNGSDNQLWRKLDDTRCVRYLKVYDNLQTIPRSNASVKAIHVVSTPVEREVQWRYGYAYAAQFSRRTLPEHVPNQRKFDNAFRTRVGDRTKPKDLAVEANATIRRKARGR